jgi:hypothetical protein
MLFQPGVDGLDRTIWEQVNDPMLIQVHQYGPVALPFSPRPIVYTERSNRTVGWSVVRTFDGTQDGVVADWDR